MSLKLSILKLAHELREIAADIGEDRERWEESDDLTMLDYDKYRTVEISCTNLARHLEDFINSEAIH